MLKGFFKLKQKVLNSNKKVDKNIKFTANINIWTNTEYCNTVMMVYKSLSSSVKLKRQKS